MRCEASKAPKKTKWLRNPIVNTLHETSIKVEKQLGSQCAVSMLDSPKQRHHRRARGQESKRGATRRGNCWEAEKGGKRKGVAIQRGIRRGCIIQQGKRFGRRNRAQQQKQNVLVPSSQDSPGPQPWWPRCALSRELVSCGWEVYQRKNACHLPRRHQLFSENPHRGASGSK